MILTLSQAGTLEGKNHQNPLVSLKMNHTYTYSPKAKLWGEEIHNCHTFTSIKLQNYLPNRNRVSDVPDVSCFSIWRVCKNSEPDPQSASDLVACNSCKIPSSCSNTPTLFHLFGPSTSLQDRKFQTSSTATFHDFPEETKNAWLLVGVIL